MEEGDVALVRLFGEQAIQEMDRVIRFQVLFSELSDANLDDSARAIVEEKFDGCLSTFFHHVSYFSLIRYPNRKIYLQLLIAVQRMRSDDHELMDYVIGRLLDRSTPLLNLREISQLASNMMMLRSLFDMGYVSWDQIMEFTTELRAQKRRARDKITFLFMYFMKEFEETSPELAAQLDSFVYKKNKRQFLFDCVADILGKRRSIAADGWKVWTEMMNYGFPQSTLAGCVVRDDVVQFQQLAAEPNFDHTQRIVLSLFHPPTLIYTSSSPPPLLGFIGFCNAIQCFKLCLLNQSGLIQYDSISELIFAGGNSEIIRLYDEFLTTQRVTPQWQIKAPILYHRNALYDWLADSMDPLPLETIKTAIAESGNMYVLKACLLTNQKATLTESLLNESVGFHQVDITKLLISTHTLDLDKPAGKTFSLGAISLARAQNDTEMLNLLLPPGNSQGAPSS